MKTIKSFKVWGISMLLTFSVGLVSAQEYVPSDEILKAREHFSDMKLGIFLHWGIYSMYAQGEWYLQNGGLNKDEYAKAAKGFYPVDFNAKEWVKAFKDAGAKYITFTSRHHDGFSMFKTNTSKYNIVDGTPFKRDVLGELAKACGEEGLMMNLYYSQLDWIREDYPLGNTGHKTGRQPGHEDYNSYKNFMKTQLTELLTNYGPIGAIWFDGYWDHSGDKTPFDWQMGELYSLIHKLQPSCMAGNNHHINPLPGEDFQMFERDVPGENKAGFSAKQSIGKLPLEMCQTMNGMWGYKVADVNYKSVDELITLLLRCAGKNSNLLINIGPQPNGELPYLALNRLKGMGEWMRQYGETVYGTRGGIVPEQTWGVSTQKGKTLYLHVLKNDVLELQFELKEKIKQVVTFNGKQKLQFKQDKKTGSTSINIPAQRDGLDFIVEVTLK